MKAIDRHPPLRKLLDEYEQAGYFMDYSNFIQELENALEDKWIPVEEDLPPFNKAVLVFVSNEDHITSGMYEKDETWTLLDEGRHVEAQHITHWRRLPNAPQ